jgi:putative MATE family efflux protein
MRSLWLANFANIVLGPVFIFGFGPVPAMGVTGAAVATTIGRGIGVIYQLQKLMRRSSRLRMRWAHLKPKREVVGGLLTLSSTGTVQILLETASWLGLVRILATFGSVALAGYTIAMRIAFFALMPAFGMSNAAATLVGQNLGAQKPDRAERAVYVVGLYNLVFLGGVGVIFAIFPAPIVGLFTTDAAELKVASEALRIIALGFLCFAYGMVLVQAFNGAGDTRTPTILNFLSFWCFKIPAAYILAIPLGLGPNGVFIAIALAYTLSAVAAFVLFRQGRWKTHRV